MLGGCKESIKPGLLPGAHQPSVAARGPSARGCCQRPVNPPGCFQCPHRFWPAAGGPPARGFYQCPITPGLLPGPHCSGLLPEAPINPGLLPAPHQFRIADSGLMKLVCCQRPTNIGLLPWAPSPLGCCQCPNPGLLPGPITVWFPPGPHKHRAAARGPPAPGCCQ